MKRKVFLGLILVVSFVFFLAVSAQVLAQGDRKEVKRIVLNQSEVVDSDYFAAGDEVVIAGTVNGDAYVAGGNVIVEGVINGDLLVAGGTVTVKGRVDEDIRAAAGNLVVSGEIGGNVTLVGGSVRIEESAIVAGSVASAAGSLNIFGQVGKDVNLGAGDALIAGKIGRNVKAGVGKLSLTSNARVGGNLNYWSENQASVDQGAVVIGENNFNEIEQKQNADKTFGSAITAGTVFFKIIWYLAAILVGVLLILIAPKFVSSVSDKVTARPLASLGVGFAVLLITPIIVVLLMVTLVGLPLAFILLFAYLISIYLAKIFVSLAVGRLLIGKSSKKKALWVVFALGLAVYEFLTLVPILGMFVNMAVLVLGMGALVLTKHEWFRMFKVKKLL